MTILASGNFEGQKWVIMLRRPEQDICAYVQVINHKDDVDYYEYLYSLSSVQDVSHYESHEAPVDHPRKGWDMSIDESWAGFTVSQEYYTLEETTSALYEMHQNDVNYRSLIGVSLSSCIRDICLGKVEIRNVKQIISGTNAESFEDQDELIREYIQTSWEKFPAQAVRAFDELMNYNRIDQPRVRNEPCPRGYGHDIWLQEGALDDDNVYSSFPTEFELVYGTGLEGINNAYQDQR